MRTLAALLLALLTLVASACAPKAPPAAETVTLAPRFPDFMRPPVPQELAGSPAAQSYDWGWRFLQAGDLRNAERELATALKSAETFYPAEAGAGYLELARKNPAAALTRFDRALTQQPDYVAALVGRGQALTTLERESEAVAAFERAVTIDPSLVDLARKVEVLRFRGIERDVADAREAARQNNLDRAVRLYQSAIASSPESAFLFRELAAVERRTGDVEQALAHFRQAAALDPGDAGTHVQIAELLEAHGDAEGALASYDAALALDVNEPVAARRDAIRARMALASLPAEFQAIEKSPQITRGDLAALLGVRLSTLLQGPRSGEATVITDVRAHWAAPWIMEVARSGVMPPYENHTFQPRAVVRRVDLAEAVSRVLPKIAALTPGQARPWQNSSSTFPDVAASHLSYPAVSAAVASGVIAAPPDTPFQLSRPVTGAEALEAVRRLEALSNLRTTRQR